MTRNIGNLESAAGAIRLPGAEHRTDADAERTTGDAGGGPAGRDRRGARKAGGRR